MADERSGYTHDASDRKLDKSAEAASDATHEHALHASARDVEHHDNDVDDNVADAGSGASAKRKS